MHVALPPNKIADLEIVNVFKPGSGDGITFPESGFTAAQCMVNGVPANFAEYLARIHADTRLPLTADYNGSVVNVSIQSVDEKAGLVRLSHPSSPESSTALPRPLTITWPRSIPFSAQSWLQAGLRLRTASSITRSRQPGRQVHRMISRVAIAFGENRL